MDAVLVGGDSGGVLLQGVKVFTALADASHPRNVVFAALLGLSGSRVLDSFYLVFEEITFADSVLKMLQDWETAGVGVIWMGPNQTLTIKLRAHVRSGLDPTLTRVRTRMGKSLIRQPLDGVGAHEP